MNCPQHVRETKDPDASARAREREELQELVEALAGNEEDYIS